MGAPCRELRLNDRVGFVTLSALSRGLGVVSFYAGENQSAMDALLRNIERGGPSNPIVQAHLVATYASGLHWLM